MSHVFYFVLLVLEKIGHSLPNWYKIAVAVWSTFAAIWSTKYSVFGWNMQSVIVVCGGEESHLRSVGASLLEDERS